MATRFAFHAAELGMGKPDLFAEPVRQGCRRFVPTDRGRGPEASSAEVDAS